MRNNIHFILNPSEITAGTRGASLGPLAILTAARTKKNTFFSQFPIQILPDRNSDLDTPTSTPFAKRIDGFIAVFENIESATRDAISQNKFPIVLAGDHGSAAGTIAGIKNANPEKRLGVIWIDAHADIHSPYTTPSGNIHGMPIAIALGEDNLHRQKNELDEHTAQCWNELKSNGGILPKIKSEDLIYVGVRDTEPEEDYLIQHLSITNFTVAQIREHGISSLIQQITQKLKDCDSWYISFDVDSMDPELTSYGTGTPVQSGISPEEAKAILVELSSNPKVVCIEFVEVNPCLDNKTNRMAEVAFELIEAVVGSL